MRSLKKIAYFLMYISPLVLLVLWEISAANSPRFTFLFGSPVKVVEALISYFTRGHAFSDTFVTATEALVGFLLGNMVGIFLGLTLAYLPKVQKFSKLFLIAFGSIPIFSLAPMMIIWFGVGIFAKIMMAFFSTLFITTLNAYSGAQEVNYQYVQLMTSLGANRFQLFKKVIIPSSLSWVIASLKLTVGFALLGAFIGEFISSDKGLGFRILKEGGVYNIPGVLAALVMIIFLAISLNKIIDVINISVLKGKYLDKKNGK